MNRVSKFYINEYHRNPVCTLVLTILLISLIIFIFAAVVTGGNSVYDILIGDRNNTFMDHFNSIMYSSDNPYTVWEVSYPPLITLFYAILGHFLIPFVNISEGEVLSFVLRDSQMGILSFFIIMILAFYSLHLVFKKLIKDKSIRTELLFLLTILSFPFIFALERGNIIFFAIVLCFIFLMGHRSENKKVRFISYIALGCAAGLKLYPAIFILLILRDRNYKEMATCAVAVLAIVFLPFLLTDGGPIIFLDTILSGAGRTNDGFMNINQLVSIIFRGSPANTVQLISALTIITFSALSFIVIIFDRQMKLWKIITLIACNLIIGPSIGTPYLTVYLVIPLLYFLVSERTATKENLFFIICFTMTLALLPGFGDPSMIIIASIKTTIIIGLSAVLLYEGIKDICKTRINNQPKIQTS